MNAAIILMLIGLLTVRELLGAYFGPEDRKVQRWMLYAIGIMLILFAFLVARQIGTILKKP